MQLLRRAHSEFTRLGGSLENKFDKSVDTHYVALNYGSSPGAVSLHLIINVDHESRFAALCILFTIFPD